MGCCNILTGYAPPRTPPSLNDFPIYIDRLHKEVWYWSGTAWETIWQVSIATDTTAGMVKVSPTSPITIDVEGFLGIDCARLKAQCNFITQAELDAAITLLRTQFTTEISRIDASIASITTSIGEILVRLGDIDNRITTLTTTVTDLSNRVSIVEGAITTITGAVTDLGNRVTIIEGDVTTLKGAVTNITGTATDVTKLKSDVARLDDYNITARISELFRNIPDRKIPANAPHADVVATVYTNPIYGQSNHLTFGTYSLSVQNGAWKQLPNSRESITISFPRYARDAPDWVTPNWVPSVSHRGNVWPMAEEFYSGHITNVHTKLLRGSTPAIDLPADYEAYLPELCATASCEVITRPDGSLGLSDALDVTIVKHTSTPKGNIIVTIEFSKQAYTYSYALPLVP